MNFLQQRPVSDLLPVLSRRRLLGLALALFSVTGRAGAGGSPPVRAAVIGTRHAHARGKTKVIRSLPEFELAGVYEPDPQRRRELAPAPEFEGVRWAALDELLGDPAIELAAIETDVAEGLHHAEMAIRAGKHVHLDKPPGADLERFKRLLEEAESRRLTVQMGYMWRYNRGLQMALESARQGWLGRVYFLRGVINSDIGTDSRPGLARFGGGMMFELGCHLIDRMVDLLGEPLRVTPHLRRFGPDDLADNTLAVFEYPEVLAEIQSSALQPEGGRHRRFEILGTNGTVVVHPIEPPEVLFDFKQKAGPYPAGPTHLKPGSPPRYVEDFLELASVIRGQRKPSYLPAHDLLVQKVLLQACGLGGEMAKPQ